MPRKKENLPRRTARPDPGYDVPETRDATAEEPPAEQKVPPAEQAAGHGTGHRFLAWAGASTVVWTAAGAISYAVLWDAHSRFYEAFGLSPDEVAIAKERLLLRAATYGFFFAAIVLTPLLLTIVGTWAVCHMARLDVIGSAALLAVALCTATFSAKLSAPDDGRFPVYTSILLWAVAALALGVLIGIYVGPSTVIYDGWRSWLAAGTLVIGAVLAANLLVALLLSRVLTGWKPGPAQIAVVAAVNLLLAYAFARRNRPWPQVEETEEDAEEAEEAEPAGSMIRRNRSLILLLVIPIMVVLVSWTAIRVYSWNKSQYDEGKQAVRLGYYYPKDWVTYWVRPVLIILMDENRDPARVCADSPGYSASLIAREGNGWWVLLRRLDDTAGGYEARTVWLPRDKYSVDLAPQAQPPKDETARDGGNRGSPGPPQPWLTPAC